MTLSLPEEVHKIAAKSKLTLSDIEEINEKIKAGLLKRYSE